MRTKITLVIFIVLAGLASGCGPVQLAQYGARRVFRESGGRGVRYDAFVAQPMHGDLSSYRQMAVEPLDNQVEEQIPSELVTALNEQLFTTLSQINSLKTVQAQNNGTTGPPAATSASDQRTVIFRGAIVDFDPGDQTRRILQVGVGRQAVMTLHLEFVDSATGEILGRYVINSEVYRLPSDGSATVGKLAKGIGDLVAGLLTQTPPVP